MFFISDFVLVRSERKRKRQKEGCMSARLLVIQFDNGSDGKISPTRM